MNTWDDPTRPVFSMNMDGGHACLDLLNTLIPAVPFATFPATENQRDLLQDYSDFVALAVRSAVLSSRDANALYSGSAKKREAQKGALEAARNFRSLLRRLLCKSQKGGAPSTRDLASFEELRTAARSFEVLIWEEGRFFLRSRFTAEGLSAPLNAFVRNADEFLRSSQLSRVRVLRSGSPDSRFILG